MTNDWSQLTPSPALNQALRLRAGSGATRVLCDANAVWRKFDTENAGTLAKNTDGLKRVPLRVFLPKGEFLCRLRDRKTRRVTVARRRRFKPEGLQSGAGAPPSIAPEARFRARGRFGAFRVENSLSIA